MLSQTLAHLRVQLVDHSGCVKGPLRHWDYLTLHPLPLHLKTYAVVSRNPIMLSESSSPVAMLGRKEVH